MEHLTQLCMEVINSHFGGGVIRAWVDDMVAIFYQVPGICGRKSVAGSSDEQFTHLSLSVVYQPDEINTRR